MLYSQLSIAISNAEITSSVSDDAWIKLTTDPPEETSAITKADLATWLDETYGIVDHCADATVEQTGETTEERLASALSGQSCYEQADLLAIASKCNPLSRAGISKQFAVYVHCSSDAVRDRYTFRCSTDISPSGPTRRSSVVEVIVDFTDADYVPVYRYVDEDSLADIWRETPPAFAADVLVGTRRVKSSNISVGYSNGRIVLSQQISGRLVVLLPIDYDVYSVSVPGIVIAGKRDYTASALAFEESLSEPAQIELSDEQEDPAEGSDCDLCGGDDTPTYGDVVIPGGSGDPESGECQRRIDWELRNQCTGDLIDAGVRYEPGPCPNTSKTEVSYTPAQTPADAKWTAEEFEDACCEPPGDPTCLPCKKIISVFGGGAPILPSEQYWRDKYAPRTVIFNRVDTNDGGPCGLRTDTFSASGGGCCAGIAAIVYIDTNPEVVSQGSSVTVAVDGGKDKITWSLSGSGQGFSFVNGEAEIESGRVVTVYASGESCGTTTITADDGCSSDKGGLSSTGGQWVLIKEDTCDDKAYLSDYCIVGEIGSDGLSTRKKYRDNWCVSPTSNCEGSEEEHCERPYFGAATPERVECIEEWEWQC